MRRHLQNTRLGYVRRRPGRTKLARDPFYLQVGQALFDAKCFPQRLRDVAQKIASARDLRGLQ